jgi:hypothetical protein
MGVFVGSFGTILGVGLTNLFVVACACDIDDILLSEKLDCILSMERLLLDAFDEDIVDGDDEVLDDGFNTSFDNRRCVTIFPPPNDKLATPKLSLLRL